MAMAQEPMEMEFASLFHPNLPAHNEYEKAIDKFLQLPSADVMSDIEMKDAEGLREELFKPTSKLVHNSKDEVERHEEGLCQHLADETGRIIGAIVPVEGEIKRKVHPRLFLTSDKNPRLTDWNMPLGLQLKLAFLAKEDKPRLKTDNNEMHQNEDDGYQRNWEFEAPQSFEAKIWHDVTREIARNLVAMGILEKTANLDNPTDNDGVVVEMVDPSIALRFEDIVVPKQTGRKRPRK